MCMLVFFSILFFFYLVEAGCEGIQCPTKGVSLVLRVFVYPTLSVCAEVCVLLRVCFCQSLPVCVLASLTGREQRWQFIRER